MTDKMDKGIELSHGNATPIFMKMEDIPGSELEKRALEVALAGGHSLAILYNTGSMAQEVVRAGVRLAQENDLDISFHAIAFPFCKCGNYGSPKGECRCTMKSIEAHLTKLAKRVKEFDIWISGTIPSTHSHSQKGEKESIVMSRVKHMRGMRIGLSDKRIAEAYNPTGRIDTTSQEMIDAYRKNVSPHLDIEKVKAIAMTIAELDYCGPIAMHHYAEAVMYQPHLLMGFNEVLEKWLGKKAEGKAG